MSEKAIQEAMQDAFQAMAAFGDADVVINDWTILDQSSLNGPYVIIENSDEWGSTQDTSQEINLWHIPFILIERFIEWSTTLDAFRDSRQAIVDAVNAGTFRSAGGTSGVNIRNIRPGGDIDYLYDQYIEPGMQANMLPVFVVQTIIAEVEEY